MTLPPPAPIATGRLDLVPLRVADADEMASVLADPALYGFIGGEPPTAGELATRYEVQARGRAADGRETWRNWIVRERGSGAAIGFVQATIVEGEASPSAELAWVVGVPWQGRGYATEAARGVIAWLDTLGVGAIVAHVHPDHAASAAVAERAGLRPTDTFLDGERAWQRRTDPAANPPAAPSGEAGA